LSITFVTSVRELALTAKYLHRIRELTQEAAAVARRDLGALVREWEDEVSRRQHLLANCEPRERRHYEAYLRDAQRELSQVGAFTAQMAPSLLSLASDIQGSVEAGAGSLARATGHLSSFGGSPGSTSSGGVVSGASGGGAIGTDGVELVTFDVDSVDYADNPIGDKWSPDKASVLWAVEMYDSVVRPGVAASLTKDDFDKLDADTGALDYRKLGRVHEMMHSDPIALDRRADRTMRVADGRHRIQAARELGIRTLPARFI